jgi:hypothetical protein
VPSISRKRREGGILAGDRLIPSPVSGHVSPGAEHILCAHSALPSPEESALPGEIMRAGRRATVTLFLSEGSAPLSRRRETMESWPHLQARWRGVRPSYREEDERRGGGIGDIILVTDFCSPLQEKRGNGIIAPPASKMERGPVILQRRMRGEEEDERRGDTASLKLTSSPIWRRSLTSCRFPLLADRRSSISNKK